MLNTQNPLQHNLSAKVIILQYILSVSHMKFIVVVSALQNHTATIGVCYFSPFRVQK